MTSSQSNIRGITCPLESVPHPIDVTISADEPRHAAAITDVGDISRPSVCPPGTGLGMVSADYRSACVHVCIQIVYTHRKSATTIIPCVQRLVEHKTCHSLGRRYGMTVAALPGRNPNPPPRYSPIFKTKIKFTENIVFFGMLNVFTYE